MHALSRPCCPRSRPQPHRCPDPLSHDLISSLLSHPPSHPSRQISNISDITVTKVMSACMFRLTVHVTLKLSDNGRMDGFRESGVKFLWMIKFGLLDRQPCMFPPVSHSALPPIVRLRPTPQIGGKAQSSQKIFAKQPILAPQISVKQ